MESSLLHRGARSGASVCLGGATDGHVSAAAPLTTPPALGATLPAAGSQDHSDGSREKLQQAWAKFFHVNDIPGLKADSLYFRITETKSQDLLKESSLARHGEGTNSSSLTKKRARDSPSVGLGDATDGHARAASPRVAPPTTPLPAQDYTDGNINKVWMHGSKLAGQGFKCGYCGTIYKGGGATRFRDHLGCIVSEVKSCPNVPRAVRDAMRELRKRSMNYPYFCIAMRLAERLAENDEEQNDEDGFEDDLA